MKTLATTLAFGALALSLATVGGAPAFAQTTAANAPACLLVTSNLMRGSTDASTGGSVTALQNFLVLQGLFSSANTGTGTFGPITYMAVVKFQGAHGISTTGYVGPLTRAAITKYGCAGTQVQTNTGVSISSFAPMAAPVGSTVTITGYGFTNDNTVLLDGDVAARDVAATAPVAVGASGVQQTITFSVPNSMGPYCPAGQPCPFFARLVSPGSYTLSVINANGTSNSTTFTVIGGNAGQTLSVNGLDAPTTLSLGQSGTWTVHALAASNSGTLHYSVLWGDEAQTATSNVMASPVSTVSTSATFTHAYQKTGSYTPTFTVTDSTGHSVNTSATVAVTPLY